MIVEWINGLHMGTRDNGPKTKKFEQSKCLLRLLVLHKIGDWIAEIEEDV